MGGKNKYIEMFGSFTEPFNSYSAHRITTTTAVAPVPCNHVPPLTIIHCKQVFCVSELA